MQNCYMTVGPPGTGKTTRLIDKAGEAARKWGGNQVMICSLTRTAAANVKERGVPIPMQQVGTMHAHCFRLLGRPEIAESHISEWNEENADLNVTQTRKSVEDEDEPSGISGNSGMGDSTFRRYTLNRARMLPRDRWDDTVTSFANRWEAWKKRNGYMDFEDLIETARNDYEHAPGRPAVIYVDEAQDCSASEVALATKWSHGSAVVFYGDLDQTIFEFRGATPRAFFDLKIPASHRTVLEDSHRVPSEVHSRAMSWIQKVSERDPVVYRPRCQGGEVVSPGLYGKNPAGLIRDAERHLKEGKKVMFLATCGFHLDPLISELRDRGIPFCNPYRETNGRWNPLGARKGVSSVDRLLAFLKPQETGRWTTADLAAWIDPVSSEVLAHRAKRLIAESAKADPPIELGDDEIMDLFDTPELASQAISAAWSGDASWFAKHLLKSKQGVYEFPLQVLQRAGKEGLKEEPRVIVGTIHSVKGGQADVVYLLPDLSLAGYKQWNGTPDERDNIVRLFYVGMTRAYEKLVLCDSVSQMRVGWN